MNSFVSSDYVLQMEQQSSFDKRLAFNSSRPVLEHSNKFHISLLQISVYSRTRRNHLIGPDQQIRLRNKKSVLLYLSLLLICQSSDVEINPGPSKFPCGDCGKASTWNQNRSVIA